VAAGADFRAAEPLTEGERAVEEARRQGIEEGVAATTRDLAARTEAAVERFCRTVEELAGYRSHLRREAEVDLVRLALSIARRILHRELTVDPDALHGLVRAGLEKLTAAEVYRLRVHPEFVTAASECLKNAGQAIEVVADAGLEPGGAVFETAQGLLDAGAETQLNEIERGFTDLHSR
jgi:flagellar assembly protein FliH